MDTCFARECWEVMRRQAAGCFAETSWRNGEFSSVSRESVAHTYIIFFNIKIGTIRATYMLLHVLVWLMNLRFSPPAFSGTHTDRLRQVFCHKLDHSVENIVHRRLIFSDR